MILQEVIEERLFLKERLTRMFLQIYDDRPAMIPVKVAQDRVLDALLIPKYPKYRPLFGEILDDVGYRRVVIDGKRWYKEKSIRLRKGREGYVKNR